MTDPTTPCAPEDTWPPRFDSNFIGRAAAFMAVLFVSVALLLWTVFRDASLFNGSSVAEHAVTFALLVIGVLLVVAGVFFALLEAKVPPPPPPPRPPTVPVNLQRFNVTDAQILLMPDPAVNVGTQIGSVANAIGDQKRSTGFLASGIVLILLAAAGSGLVNISVGDPDATTTPGSTTTTAPAGASTTSAPAAGGDSPPVDTTTSAPG